MSIGQAAHASGLPAKTIRYYEEIGLIGRAERTDAGYRIYTEADVHTLRFINRARSLEFSLEEVRQLLALWQDRNRSNTEVRQIALGHVSELDLKINELVAMRDVLRNLASHCHADGRPDCPILSDIAEATGISPGS
ncbi:Cu(I)-responsive transcriptional regulator [Microvirga sp. VF16]|uniref:Cu(I)-responsive transcriptional regulator n=1 Tax=Microvirga sp. VF16 TaxID=2807101 RepID=UPI00193CBEF9|nr:Cu(I)-responsive transcriptional regulator [Microvirga sp. VF16]QRM34672.1 Cu(I)-responsive transcriptional regulator [Microvirga sp. VF16]